MNSRLSFQPVVRTFALLLAVSLLSVAAPDATKAQRISYSPRVSTLGVGGDLTIGLSSKLNLRAGASYLTFSYNGMMKDEVDVQYDVDGRLAAAQLLLDWHPFGNAFRFSIGGVYNGTQVTGQARPVDSYTVQQKTFEPERLGSLDAEVSFANKINPYVGIGLGNSVQGSPLDMFIDLGAMYVAQPEVQMSGTGLISATINHESTLNEGLRSFHILPYVALGLSLRL